MGHGVVHIDLPKACEPLPDFLVRQNTEAERRLTFDILVECDLGTKQQADRNVRVTDRRESPPLPLWRNPSRCQSRRRGRSAWL
jgi:hypothetical protein